jgi:hypothetical protein
MKLSGQEYVDEYAQRAKVRLTSALYPGGRGHPGTEDGDEDESHEPSLSSPSLSPPSP